MEEKITISINTEGATMVCKQCGKETHNPAFCSSSCAAIYNNLRRPKKQYFCTRCGDLLGEGYIFKDRKICNKCNKSYVDWSKITYEDMLNRYAQNRDAHIRDIARRLYARSDKPKCCANCGYTKHYEICHIKAIESHALETPMSVVNGLNNLIALCPNCHWELDKGLLQCKEEWRRH